ncbi:MAG: TetR/AcrR family transcriptional regulator [Frankiales bacterium]|nr:TetR/AcrR family transcriptional regulator [Frankiales bacterium]
MTAQTPTMAAAGPRASTRTRLVDAAREQLLDPRGLVGFNIDAVARRAGVSRQTVYNQFGSKAGLLDAVCDTAAARTGLAGMLPAAFSQANPETAMSDFIRAFGIFWGTDRDLNRRTRGLSELEPEYAAVLQARDQRRVDGLSVLLARFPAPAGFSRSARQKLLLRLLQTVTSFATFDGIAGPDKTSEQASATVTRIALAAIRDAGLTVGPLGAAGAAMGRRP